jgi:hypothetical protein
MLIHRFQKFKGLKCWSLENRTCYLMHNLKTIGTHPQFVVFCSGSRETGNQRKAGWPRISQW